MASANVKAKGERKGGRKGGGGEGRMWRDCTSGFGHLLSIQHEVTVAAHAFGPLVRSVLPDGGVVVQGKAQVVVDQVLARGLQLASNQSAD